jgi:VWFA-related protein
VLCISPRAQTPAQQPVFRTDVTLIEIDAVVRDEQGKPVRGLTAADFVVKDRGVAQPIDTFEEVSRLPEIEDTSALPPTVRRDVATNRDAIAERLIVLAIDDSVPSDRRPQLAALARQVVDRLGSGASVALLTVSREHQVETTSNLALVYAAIERTVSAPLSRRARTTKVETGVCPFRLMQDAAKAVRSENVRRKAVVLLSPFCAVQDLPEAMRVMAGLGNPALEAAVEMVEEFRKSNVALYAVDPRGAHDFSLGHFPAPDITRAGTGAGGSIRGCQLASCDPVLLSQVNLTSVTEATSGFAVTDTDEIEAGMDAIIEDLDHYYLLGFRATDPTDYRFRPLEVECTRPGVTIRYRKGYQIPKPEKEDKKLTELDKLAVGVLPNAALPLRLYAMARPARTDKVPVVLGIEIGDELPDAAPSGHDALEVAVFAVNLDKTKVTETMSVKHDIPYMPTRDGARRRATLTATMPLKPGKYQLRVSVKSDLLKKSGSVYGEVEVTQYSKTPVDVGDLIVTVAGRDDSDEILYPDMTDRFPFEPTFDRVFMTSDRLRVYFDVWRRDQKKALQARLVLIDMNGNEVRAIDTDLPPTAPAPLGLLRTIDLSGIAPGGYRLRATATDGKATAAREIAIAVK